MPTLNRKHWAGKLRGNVLANGRTGLDRSGPVFGRAHLPDRGAVITERKRNGTPRLSEHYDSSVIYLILASAVTVPQYG